MDKNEFSQVADLAVSDGAPRASILTPDVRSGSSFTYSTGVPDFAPPFLIVWFYTVETTRRVEFATKVSTWETSAVPQGPNIFYRGTYSVSISAVAPDLEYRTLWGLKNLASLQDLNDYLNNKTSAQLTEVLKVISDKTAMRSEIMGRTITSAPLASGN
jgi:hypothetical protein